MMDDVKVLISIKEAWQEVISLLEAHLALLNAQENPTQQTMDFATGYSAAIHDVGNVIARHKAKLEKIMEEDKDA